MKTEIFLKEKARLLEEANNSHNHVMDRISAWLKLGFLYGQDYHEAYKCFRKAQDLVDTK